MAFFFIWDVKCIVFVKYAFFYSEIKIALL